jgi:hypothetical protein
MSKASELGRLIHEHSWSLVVEADWQRTAESLKLLAGARKIEGRAFHTDLSGNRWAAYFDDRRLERVQVSFDVFMETETLTGEEYSEKLAGYFKRFETAEKESSVLMGRAIYVGKPRDEDDEDNLRLAIWNTATARVTLAVRSEGPDVPIRFVFEIVPKSR